MWSLGTLVALLLPATTHAFALPAISLRCKCRLRMSEAPLPAEESFDGSLDAIYKAGASNLSSVHKDFEELGVAYDLSVIDRALTEDEVHGLVAMASEVTGDDNAIRSVRQIRL